MSDAVFPSRNFPLAAKASAAQAADKAREAADAASKTDVYVALSAFMSLLVRAFSACYMATAGGGIRDDLPLTGWAAGDSAFRPAPRSG